VSGSRRDIGKLVRALQRDFDRAQSQVKERSRSASGRSSGGRSSSGQSASGRSSSGSKSRGSQTGTRRASRKAV
jgi:hypothetical protein